MQDQMDRATAEMERKWEEDGDHDEYIQWKRKGERSEKFAYLALSLATAYFLVHIAVALLG